MGKTTVEKVVEHCHKGRWDDVFLSCASALQSPEQQGLIDAVHDRLDSYRRQQFAFVARDAAGHLQQPSSVVAGDVSITLMVIPFVARDGRGLDRNEIAAIERCVELHTDGNCVQLLPDIFTPRDLDAIPPASYAAICEEFWRTVECPGVDVARYLHSSFDRERPFDLPDTVSIGVLLGARIEILPGSPQSETRADTYLDELEVDDSDLIDAIRERVPRIEHVCYPHSISRGIPHALLQEQVMRLGEAYETLSRNGNATVEITQKDGGAIVRSWTDDGKMLFEEAVAVGASGVCPNYLPHLIRETMTVFGAFMKTVRRTGHIERTMH